MLWKRKCLKRIVFLQIYTGRGPSSLQVPGKHPWLTQEPQIPQLYTVKSPRMLFTAHFRMQHHDWVICTFYCWMRFSGHCDFQKRKLSGLVGLQLDSSIVQIKKYTYRCWRSLCWSSVQPPDKSLGDAYLCLCGKNAVCRLHPLVLCCFYTFSELLKTLETP